LTIKQLLLQDSTVGSLLISRDSLQTYRHLPETMISSRRPRSGGGGSQPKFIYQLPLRQYKEIEDLLNMNEAWEHLAGQILCFKVTEIEKFRRHNQKPDSSAADALLKLLCNKNTTIEEMFDYLHKIQLFRGMDILKDFVPERLHSMIRYGADLTQTQSLPYMPTYKEYSHPLHVPPKMNSQDFNVEDVTMSHNVSARHSPVSAARQSGYRPAFQRHPAYEDRQSGQIRHPGGQNSPGGQDGFARYPGHNSPGPEGGHVRYTGQHSYDGYPGHAYPSFERGGPYSPQNRAPYPIYERSEHPSIQSEQYSQHPSMPPYGRYHSNERPMYQQDYQYPSNEQSYPYQQYGASPGASLPPSEFMRRPRIRNPSEPTSEVSAASSAGGVPTVSDKELAEACDNWNIENRIGKGGYGEVYRGVWKYQDVAVKRIRKMEHLTPQDEEHFQHSIKQCWKEINYLNRLRSEYIVPILAHSASGEPCIAYQFMPNGSLHDRLKKSGGTPALSWQQRYNIAKGTACGLQFLHRQDPVHIHGDIKSANILLDKAFEPKIGDFGLAREKTGDPKNTHMKLSQIHGTQFYLPDDFLRTKQLSTKVDTYSFGVVLFDLVTGKSPSYKDPVTKTHLLDILKGEESLPGNWVDTTWAEHTQDFHLCALLFKFGKWCTKERKKERPEMKEVFEGLQRELERIRIRKESGPEHKSMTPIELQQKYDSMERQNSNEGPRKMGGGPGGGDYIAKEAQNVMGAYKISGGGFTIAQGGSEGGGDVVETKDENVVERKDRQSVPDLIRFSSSSSNTSAGESTGIVRVSTDSSVTSPRGSLPPLPECTSFYSDICVVKDSSQETQNILNKIPETTLESSIIPNLSILVETNSCDTPDFSNLVGQESETIPDVSSLIRPGGPGHQETSNVGVSQVSQPRMTSPLKSYQIPDISGLAISDCSGALPDLSGLVGGDDQQGLPDFSGLVTSGESGLVNSGESGLVSSGSMSGDLPDFSQLSDNDRLDSIEDSADQAEALLRALF